ncbi:MAG: hypothetical protein AAGA80_07195 [Cyanobacteria bacterium P01_F01_bin.143]
MPENLAIATFVFGAILILIGIIGGNFKLFGSEVSETISNRWLRFISFGLGTFFLVLALEIKLPVGSNSELTPTLVPTPTPYSTPIPHKFSRAKWGDFEASSSTHYFLILEGPLFPNRDEGKTVEWEIDCEAPMPEPEPGAIGIINFDCIVPARFYARFIDELGQIVQIPSRGSDYYTEKVALSAPSAWSSGPPYPKNYVLTIPDPLWQNWQQVDRVEIMEY